MPPRQSAPLRAERTRSDDRPRDAGRIRQVSQEQPWWRHGVIYQIYIRSFADSDGDGIGDLGGIRSRLPYLRDLGVDAIWITPFYPSPMADGGYDVADYRDIEPQFGSLSEAEELVRDAHDARPQGHHRHRPQPLLEPARRGSVPHWRPSRGRRSGRATSSARVVAPTASSRPTTGSRSFGGSAWRRLPDGDWYLHLFAPGAAGLQLGESRGRRGLPSHAALLARPRRRRFPHRRRQLAEEGPATLPDLSGFDEAVLTAHSGPDHPIWDRDEVHEIYRGWRQVMDEYEGTARLRRGGLGAGPRAAGALRAARRAAHGVQLPVPARPVGGRRAAADDR